jgi:hypothetical protein
MGSAAKLSFIFPQNLLGNAEQATRVRAKITEVVGREALEENGSAYLDSCTCSTMDVYVTHVSELHHWFSAIVQCPHCPPRLIKEMGI